MTYFGFVSDGKLIGTLGLYILCVDLISLYLNGFVVFQNSALIKLLNGGYSACLKIQCTGLRTYHFISPYLGPSWLENLI